MYKIFKQIFSCRRCGNQFPLLTYKNFSNSAWLQANNPENVKKPRSTAEMIKKLWLMKHANFLKQYQDNIEKRFPKMKIMRVFNTGLKELYLDTKKYVAIRKKQWNQGVQTLTREEFELSYKLPRELFKVSPILIISTIPFTNYLIFPLIFFFPRVFLVSYFWTIQQRLEFFLYEYKRKLKHNKSVFRSLQAQKAAIVQSSLKTKWKGVIANLGSGTHPTVFDIIDCKELFMESPYSLNTIKNNHVSELLSMHNMTQWLPYRRKRLYNRGMLIKRMDNAILNEGGVSKVPIEALKWAVSFRGLNPVNMSTESMQEWLNQWLIVSSEVDKKNISLLLHCPVLLAYNHPSNWTLLHR